MPTPFLLHRYRNLYGMNVTLYIHLYLNKDFPWALIIVIKGREHQSKRL